MYKEFELYYLIRQNSGISINMLTMENPTLGYMVGKVGSELQVPLDLFNQNHVAAFITRHFTELASERAFLGAWVNEGIVYLDVSRNIFDREKAVALARRWNQLAIWDVENGVSIPIE